MGFPFDENKIFTGAKGKLIDANGLELQETSEFNGKLTPEYGDVKVGGSIWTGQKQIGLKGTGTLKKFEISNALNKAIAEAAMSGAPFVTQFIGECGNDSGDTYRVLFQNVKFTGDIELAKWQAQTMTENDLAFSFTSAKYL